MILEPKDRYAEEKLQRKCAPNRARRIVAVRPDGEIAGSFDSIVSVQRLYGFSPDAISAQIHRRRFRTLHGLQWYFEEDYRKQWEEKGPESFRFEPDRRKNHATGRYLKESEGGEPCITAIRRKDPERYRKIVEIRRERFAKMWDNGAFNWHRKSIRCVTDGRIFATIKDTAKFYGLSKNTVRDMANSGREGTRRAKGLRFEHLDASNKTTFLNIEQQ